MSGMRIEKILLKNFKCHNHFEMELRRLNIFQRIWKKKILRSGCLQMELRIDWF